MASSTSSQSPAQSPLKIPLEDVVALSGSEGFQILRQYLAHTADNTFCDNHAASDYKDQETWLLHRDLLHALVMPVVELFSRASVLAEAALCNPKQEDLELAFEGEARDAFLCLQCFITEEEDWCRTRGCPACVTTATLSTESHIRLTIAASLLSTASIATPASSPASSAASSPIEPNPPASPATGSGLTLPPLPHILPALREALSSDPFWGPEFWSYLFSRATQLSAGIQALIAECVNLESLVSSPVVEQPTVKRNAALRGLEPISEDITAEEEKGAKLRKSKLAKRQLRMKGEEMDLMRRWALQCWAATAVPSQLRKDILGTKEKRVRSLTCP